VAKPRLDNVLAAVPLFRGLPRRHLKSLAALCEVADYMAGATVVKQGEIGDSFYAVLTGNAKVTANGRFLKRLLPGDTFGEISLLDGGPRTASVVTETAATLLVLERRNFIKALRGEPELSLHLMSEIAGMFRRVSKDVDTG
jgi:CRP-like cAMP-binding protein